MSQCPSNYFLLYRDQVELADGDALVPVAHFSKEVRIILPGVNSELAFYYVQEFKLDLDDIRSFLLSAALSWYSCDRWDHTFPSQVQSSLLIF